MFKQQERLREDYPNNLKPIYDVATRWNSTYYSWVRLLDLKKAISILQSHMIFDSNSETKRDGRKLQKILLDDNEWHLIKQLVEVLEKFDTITSTLSGKNFVTLSLVTPIIFFLKKIFLETLITMRNEEENDNNEE